jgi:hypothetical protein
MKREMCPGWDSNPHWTVFETASSTGWDTGAQREEYRRSRVKISGR